MFKPCVLLIVTLLTAQPSFVLAEKPGETCMSYASLVRTDNIKAGIKVADADRIWAFDVAQCSKQRARRRVKRRVSQTKVSRYVPPGRRGAPKGTAGVGSRFELASLYVLAKNAKLYEALS